MTKYLFPNRIKKLIAGLMIPAFLLGLAGCSNAKADIPELMEPVSQTEAYRPVSRRRVGKMELLDGQVVPKDYPCFSEKPVSITEVTVGVGDYVEEGTVIARGDISAINDQINAVSDTISSLTRKRSMVSGVADAEVKKMEYEKHIEEYIANDEGVRQKDTDIVLKGEDKRFDVAVIDDELSYQRNELAEQSEEAAKYVYTAPHSGYVTYVKDFSNGNSVEPFENIVVISDYDDTYVEVEKIALNLYKYEDYKSKWTMVDGKKVAIEEYPYTNKEMAYALSVGQNPPMAFIVKGAEPEIGTNLTLYFMEGDDTEKLAIGNDSIFREGAVTFVYVRGKDGTDERREVELGVSDNMYTEVISGLEEGEEVFYKSTSVVPEKYELYDVVLGDYLEESTTEFMEYAYPYYDIYIADCPGKYHALRGMGMASPGEPLFNIMSNVGSGDIEEARLAVSNLDKGQEEAKKEYQTNKTSLEEMIKGAEQFDGSMLATDTDALRENMLLAERTECDLDILKIQFDYNTEEYSANRARLSKNYQDLLIGTGVGGLDVNVRNGGRISRQQLYDDATVEKGNFIMTVEKPGNDNGHTRIYSCMADGTKTSNPISPMICTQVKIVKDDKTITGHCIGINGNSKRYMLFTRNGKEYTTYSSPFAKGVDIQYFLEMDSEVGELDMKDAVVKFNGRCNKNVVVVPSIAVHTEVNQLDSTEEKNYVWKLENGNVVKEYVTIYKSKAATGSVYIIDGVEPGDQVLK